MTETGKSGAYAAAGVDIAAGERAVDLMRAAVQSTYTPAVLGGVGQFGALVRAPHVAAHPGAPGQVLVSSADGVGTKIKVATELDRHDTIGRDLVHHCVNDVLTLGARPLFFLDYLGLSHVVPETVATIVGGLAAACRDHGMALVGGETAEMPDVYAPGDYDLAGFIVGTVAEDEIVDGSTIAPGDAVIGLPSSGLHTNGYSLARRVLAGLDPHADAPDLGCTLADELLRPHRCYLPDVAPLLDRRIVKGMAHITGGGLPGNVPRVLPAGLGVALDPTTWDVPPIFRLIEQRGRVERAEMYRVLNMGIGYVVICARARAGDALAALTEAGGRVIGEVVENTGDDRVMGLS